MAGFEFYKDQMDFSVVETLSGPHIDLSDPANPILPEFVLKSVYDLGMINKADIDGGGTTGGVWYQDTILSDLFPNYKQVIRVLGGQMAIEYGNVELDVHRFVVTSVSGLKVKVGSAEYTVWNEGNFNPDSKANTDGSNASGALAATIGNNHNHANKSIIDSITAQDLIDWDNASTISHNAVTLGANSAGIDFNTATQRLQFQNGYQLPTTIKLGEYDEAFLMRHAHTNKLVLDNLTQSVIDNSHTHGNKVLLDSYNQTNANIADAVSLRHSHINKAILDAITAAYTTADKHTLDALAGIQLEADQANALIRIKDGNGNVLSTLNVAFLNNEGTQFVYNPSSNTLDLINDYGQTLSSIPVSSFVTNLVSNANWNGTTPSRLDFKDNAGTILFSIDYSIANIQGLQNALNLKAQVDGSNTTGGFWNIKGIISSNFAASSGGNGQVFNTGTDTLYLGNPSGNTKIVLESSNWDLLHYRGNLGNAVIWTGHNFDPNSKANTSGYYSGLDAGLWNGQTYSTSASGNPLLWMVYDDNSFTWRASSKSETQSVLGITTALNLNLQQVTNNGNSTTLPLIIKGMTIGDEIYHNNPIPFLNNLSNAQRILTGGVLASDSYADASLIPTNGIYSKGTVRINEGIMLTKTAVPQDWSIYQDNVGVNFYVTGGTYQGDVLKIKEDGTLTTLLHGTSADWYQAYLDTQNLNNNFIKGSNNAGTLQNFNFAIGYDGVKNFIQSHNNTPLHINPLGNGIYVGGHISALFGGATLTFDRLENYGSPIEINANASLGIRLQANGSTVMYVLPNYVETLKDLYVSSGSNIYTSNFGSADQWNEAYNKVQNAFEKESVNFVLDINTHALGLYSVTPATANLPFATYGVVYCYKAATTWWFQQFKDTNGNIWERRAVNPANVNDWLPWVKTNSNTSIDNYVQNLDIVTGIGFIGSDADRPYFYHSSSSNVVELATRNWVNNNFTSKSALGNYLKTDGTNFMLDSISFDNNWKIGASSFQTGNFPFYYNGNVVALFNQNGNLQIPNATAPNHAVALGQLANYALTNGSNTVGGTWDIWVINSTQLQSAISNGQIFNTNAGQIYWGNPNVNLHTFEATNADSLRVYASNVGGYGIIWNSLNLKNVSQLVNDANYTTLAIVQSQGYFQFPSGGNSGQYLNGLGQLVNFPTIPPQLVYTGSNGINVTGTTIIPTYGTTTNTIAQGNDTRILNGQTAFGWGNHAGLYPLLSGSYANPSWITSIDWAKITNAPTIPTVGNGNITYTGTGAITGGGTSTANQNSNTSYTFDLTTQTKADIKEGTEAKTQISNLFQDLSQYYKYTNVSAGGFYNTVEAFMNVFNPMNNTPNVDVEDHYVPGARLILQGVSGAGVVNYHGNFIDKMQQYQPTIALEGADREYVWDDYGAWRQVL